MSSEANPRFPAPHTQFVGDISVTVLNDGYFDFPFELFLNNSPEEVRALSEKSPQKLPMRGFLNSFLIEVGQEKILVDGGGGSISPTVGNSRNALASLGVTPQEITKIVTTHLHADHVAGLLDSAGETVYPHAEVFTHAAEVAFWNDKGLMARADKEFQFYIGLAQSFSRATAFQTTQFSAEQDVVPGVRLLPTPGHTPGHTMILVSSGRDQLLIWGDIVHVAAIQFPQPDWHLDFDMDGELGAATRRRTMDRVAQDRIAIMGCHLPFPAVGYVVRDGSGFRFEPAFWEF
ncbi:MAG: MBL fold metallo-hydrolase [Fimbriimonadaceae bacterium]|jgi:glyoxylase-like metal-dependent hydrolase (beta-lactamase superfamily II)|nr:MBL fold metallo-hydrolase [Fimbriimonadaceae bacterium]